MRTLRRKTIVCVCTAVCCSIEVGQAAPAPSKPNTMEVKEIKAVVNRFWSAFAVLRRGSTDTGPFKSTLAWPLMLMHTNVEGTSRVEVYRDEADFDKMVAEETALMNHQSPHPFRSQDDIKREQQMKREQQSEKFAISRLQVTIVSVGVAQVTANVTYKHKNPRFGAPHYLYDTVKLLTILCRQQPREIRSKFPGKWKVVFSGLSR